MSQNILSSDLDDHMEALLRLFQTTTSEANRSSRQNRVLSLCPDRVTRNSVNIDDPYVRDHYMETRFSTVCMVLRN